MSKESRRSLQPLRVLCSMKPMDPLSLGITSATVSLVTSCVQVSNLLGAFRPPEGGVEEKKVKNLSSEISTLSHSLSNIERTVQCEPFPYNSPASDSSDSSASRTSSIFASSTTNGAASAGVSESYAASRSSSDHSSTRSGGRAVSVTAQEAHWKGVAKVMGDCNATLQEIRSVLEDAVGKSRHFMQKTRTHIRVAQFYSRVDSFLLRVRSYRDAVDITQLMLSLGPMGDEEPAKVREAVDFVKKARERMEWKKRRSGVTAPYEREFVSVRSVGNYVRAAAGALAEISIRTEGISRLSLDTQGSWGNESPPLDTPLTPSDNPSSKELAALKAAAIKGDLATIATLTELYTVESLTSAEVPVVVLAAKYHHDFCVNMLVNSGFDVNTTDGKGNTALHHACGNRDDHSFLVSSLVCNGADATRRNETGSTPLHEAAAAGNIPAIKELLPHDVDVHARDDSGDTPLHRAASTADAMTVQLLLDNGADPHAKGSQTHTPLHCGCLAGNLGVLRVLVEAGCDVNLKTAAGNTPLIFACDSGTLPCVRVLLKAGADIKMSGESGKTPLHAASRCGAADVVEALLENGADPDVKGTAGDTPLNFAAAAGFENVVRLLVDRGANTRNRGGDGRTAVEEARMAKHEPVVTFLERVKLNLDT